MGAGVITVRRLEADDLPAVAGLAAANQPQPWTIGIFEDELQAKDRCYLVAEAGAIVGFGGVMVVGEDGHVTNLLVAPEQRRRGIGRELFVTLVREAIALGARNLTLEVRADNVPARRLYGQFGLVPVGIRPGYYQGEDALILWAHDIDDRPGRLQ